MARRFYGLAVALVLLGALGYALPSPLFGVLDLTPALNALHIMAGVIAGAAASRGLGSMRAAGRLLGFLFAALAAAAFIFDAPAMADVLPLSTNNAWMHLILALVFLYHALLAPPTV
jgi:hypothetical protein